MAADVDIFPNGERPAFPLSGRWRCTSRCLRWHSSDTSFPAGRGESWGGTAGRRRRNERDAGQQRSVAASADPDAERTGQRVEGPGAITAQRNPKEEPKAIPIPDARPSERRPQETTQKKPPPKQVAKAGRQQGSLWAGRPGQRPYGSFRFGRRPRAALVSPAERAISAAASPGTWMVRRKVSENWLKYEVDPRIDTARRVYIYFEITARARRRIFEWNSRAEFLRWTVGDAGVAKNRTFGPLPPDYSGNYVAVEFWFDYQR